MSIAPEGPNNNTGLQKAWSKSYKTVRNHGKTVQKTGLIQHGRKPVPADVSPYCHVNQRVTSANFLPSLTKSWPFSLTLDK
jgi:hypothetical protein